MIPDTGNFVCYTDGSCSGKVGGWGFVILGKNLIVKGYGGGINTTVNHMEMFASIMALKCFTSKSKFFGPVIEICTDSKYLYNGITEYIYRWKKNNYTSSTGDKILNTVLWEELYSLQMLFAPEWGWVKGHAGVKYNEVADDLAREGRFAAQRYIKEGLAETSIHNFFKTGKAGVVKTVKAEPLISIERLNNG